MANVIIQEKDMIKKQNPADKWGCLGLKTWTSDIGFIRAMNERRKGLGDYLVTDKAHKSLWDLITYFDDDGREVIIKYYEFPKELLQFINFVWHRVATTSEWHNKKGNSNKEQMDHFPYSALWDAFNTQILNPKKEEATNA